MRKKIVSIIICGLLGIMGLNGIAYGKKVAIEWWGEMTGFEALGIEKAVKEFNVTHPNIKVDYTGQPDLDKKVVAAVMAGNPPTVASVGDNQNFPQFVAGGLYAPLDEFLDEVGINFQGYWQPWTTKAVTLNGKTYALPYTDWSLILVYNKDMFREVGLDPLRPPRLIEDFDQAQEKLTKRDADGNIKQIGLSFRAAFPGWFCAYYSYLFGATPETLYDSQEKRFLKPKELYQTWEWLQSYAKKYGAKDLERFVGGFGDWGTAAEPFLSGKMAMTWNGPWIADHISRFAPNMNYDVASLPAVEKVVKKGPFGIVGIDTFSIPKGAKNVREGLEFMKWFASKKGQTFLNVGPEGCGRCPTVRDYGGMVFVRDCVTNPYIYDFINMFNSPAVQPIPFGSPAEAAYNTEFTAVRDPVLNLEISAREAVDEAISRAQKVLEKQKT